MDLFVLNEDVAAKESALLRLQGETRLDVLIVLAWHLRQRDCKRSLLLADEADDLLSRANVEDYVRRRSVARLKLVRGEVCWLYAELDVAESHAASAISAFAHVNDHIGVGDGNWLLASIWHDRGNGAQRDAVLKLAEDHYRVSGDPTRVSATGARILERASFRDANAAANRLTQAFDMTVQHSEAVTAWLSSARALVAAFTCDPANAIKYFFDAHHAALLSGQMRQAMVTATNGADTFANLGDLASALEWNERCLALTRERGWPGATGNALLQTGNVLRLLGRLDEARAMLGEALVAMATLTKSQNYALALQYLGELSLDVSEPAVALDYFNQAEQRAVALGEPIFVLRCWYRQANALCHLARPEEACAKVAASLALATREGSEDEQIKVLRVYAELHQQYRLPPPEAMSLPSSALHYLNEALAIAGTINGYVLPSELLDELAAAHAAVGDYRQAFVNAQAAAAARDHRRLSDARNRAIAMQVRQETERAHAEAEHHRQLAETEAKRAASLQEASATLETLGLIGREITASLNADAVFSTLYRHVHQLLDATSFRIYMLDASGQILRGAFGIEAGQPSPVVEIPINAPNSFAARCASERQEIVIDAVPTELVNLIPGTLNTLSLLFTPLLIGARLLGVMTIQSIQAQAYGERERSIFRTLCAYGAIALDNAAAYRQSEVTLKTLRETQAQLEEVSVTDALTGLRNRRFLLQHIERDVALVLRRYDNRAGDPTVRGMAEVDLVFFMVDIDHFKSVNDLHGHAAGDMVLVQMRERLQEVFRESDYLIRWGGEEFLLVARAANRADAATVAERIRVAVSSRAFVLSEGVKLAKTCSIGFACYPFLTKEPRLLSWSQVVELADQGLYMAKHAGRNGWVGLLGPDLSPTDGLFGRLMHNPEQAIDAGELQCLTRISLHGPDTAVV